MDKDLKALFQILQKKGVFKTEESMMAVIEAEGIEVLFPVMPEGMFNSVESFASAFPGAVKKKRLFRTYFSRGRYGIHYTSGAGRTYLIGVFKGR